MFQSVTECMQADRSILFSINCNIHLIMAKCSLFVLLPMKKKTRLFSQTTMFSSRYVLSKDNKHVTSIWSFGHKHHFDFLIFLLEALAFILSGTQRMNFSCNKWWNWRRQNPIKNFYGQGEKENLNVLKEQSFGPHGHIFTH